MYCYGFKVGWKAFAHAQRPEGSAEIFSLWYQYYFFFTHGNVFVLGGHDFQTQFTHDLPAEKHVKEWRVGLVIRAREEVSMPEEAKSFVKSQKRRHGKSSQADGKPEKKGQGWMMEHDCLPQNHLHKFRYGGAAVYHNPFGLLDHVIMAGQRHYYSLNFLSGWCKASDRLHVNVDDPYDIFGLSYRASCGMETYGHAHQVKTTGNKNKDCMWTSTSIRNCILCSLN